MNNKVNACLPEIQKYFKKHHQEFLKKYGTQIDKLTADGHLKSELVYARLLPILILLQKEGIIDEYKLVSSNSGALFKNKTIALTKKDYDSAYVLIITNGSEIVIEGYKCSDFISLKDYLVDTDSRFTNVLDDDFDWLNFSKRLLSCIHDDIYERAKAADAKIKTMLNNE